MSQKTQYSKALVAVLAFAMFAVGCTKSREAELPYEMQKSVFAISEFGETQTENSQFSLETDNNATALSLGNSSKATAEKGVVALDSVKVPSRLKYMFGGLEITGQTDHTYPITFSVDKQFVTAYKIVTNPDELTILEKSLAQVQEEVVLQKQLQKNDDRAKAKTLLASLQKAREQKVQLMGQKSVTLLVPLFKYKVEKFGILERKKNELKENTSTLDLTETNWSQASHIVINTTKEGRLPVGLDPAQSGDLDRTFVMDRINNKIMSAGTLNSEFQIPVNLAQDARVLTLLDTKALHVFEITQLGKADLTDSQRRQLQTGANGNVRACPADVVKALPADAQKDCVMILRYDIDVTYVRPELPVVDYEGNQDNKVNFKPVLSGQNIGLVQIPKDVEPKKVESNNELDPNTTVRIADIKDKEFFFKRTMEDASYSADSPGLTPGMAGAITIAKFEFEEDRVVLRKADKLINYKTTSNDADYEELMSLPVKYLKLETKDGSGAAYAMPKLVPATRVDAQYIEVDWTKNTIPQTMSPYAAIYDGCILGTASTQVSDMDMRLTSGVLNFSQKYSLALKPECIGTYTTANDYNAAPGYQYTARVTERISLKVNDGSTDTSFVKDLPFKAQNTLGYGVWTTAQITPNSNGQMGREGMEVNHQMVHDFRNGKVLKYTITGLPTDDPEMRKLYVGIVDELVKSWNFAYKQAFAGSALDRSGPYITYEIAGENGVTAHLGDLDKNIFHFENKFSATGILGVSQVGFNPRSAIVVADSLILYAGNVKGDVINNYDRMKLRAKWEEMKDGFRKQARENLAKEQDADKKAAAGTTPPANASGDEKVDAAKAFGRKLIAMTKGPKVGSKAVSLVKNMGLSATQMRTAISQRKALGGSGSFAYSSPNDESAWMDRALRTITQNPSMSVSDIRGVIAKELLASKGAKMSERDRADLNSIVRESTIRARMMDSFKVSPGCLQTEAEVANSNFIKMSFNDAFRIEALNTMVHEMGHSQGLTHNFIGSYDKANFANEDGSPSKRNYSSVMDYLTPGRFSWDGLGTYDIHAIRASHLGLFEVTPEFKTQLGANAAKVLVQDKYISIDTIQKAFAKNGWANFTKANINGVLRPYKYCTDIDVEYDPMCQRHDFGSTVSEVIESIKSDWEDNYINGYHGWNRLNYSVGNAYRALGASQYYMLRMRRVMDETFYKFIMNDGTQEEKQDYVQAALKSYVFFIQMLTTPDTTAGFESSDRFIAVPYDKKELNDKGEPTGNVTKDVAIVEKRALSTLSAAGDVKRVDTLGLEMDKVTALELLTMKGYPIYKYTSQSLDFSYLDFEKYLLGMSTDNSVFVNIVTGMMLNQLQPTFTNEDVLLQPIPDETATVSSTMRAYAAIYGILNLEASTLKDKDNFATLFKVGSSVGKGPADRLSLSQLGVSDQSKTRMTFWALDNASSSQAILKIAGKKNFFIQKNAELQPLLEKLITAEFQGVISAGSADKAAQDKIVADVVAAKAALAAKLNALNKNGDVVSADELAANPNLKIESQVEAIAGLNVQLIQISVGLLTGDEQVTSRAGEFAAQAAKLADNLPLVALDQKALVSALTTIGEAMSKTQGQEAFAQLGQAAGQIASEQALETSYGIIMKNVEFLNKLTNMTNPEYAR